MRLGDRYKTKRAKYYIAGYKDGYFDGYHKAVHKLIEQDEAIEEADEYTNHFTGRACFLSNTPHRQNINISDFELKEEE